MDRSSGLTLDGIRKMLGHLADRVLVRRDPGVEPYVFGSLNRVVDELGRFIPGIEPAADAPAAARYAKAAQVALEDGEEDEAFSYALRGLSCSVHDPVLWYLAGSACVEIGSLELGMRLLKHALWIHPGYVDARRDLDTLESFFNEEGYPSDIGEQASDGNDQ